jgi:redox-sensitive bicupin YhaK (pirin superfamily)
MSWLPDSEPECVEHNQLSAVRLVISPRARDLGSFSVRRVLPSGKQQMVGPFIFFDHMGPVTFAAGQGMDVRPHPHIGLATVTYLFSGSMMHRDSLGCEQLITPGAVNWMVAGRGIAHSERSSDSARQVSERLEGLQIWVALPLEQEEMAPQFTHYPATSLPQIEREGVTLRVLAGEAFGVCSPVVVQSPLFYVDAILRAGESIVADMNYSERAIYIVSGKLNVADEDYEAGSMLVLVPQRAISITASSDTRFVIIGGEPFAEARHVWWNFVSSSRARIEQAKTDWRLGRFDKVGDDMEFIPLPD